MSMYCPNEMIFVDTVHVSNGILICHTDSTNKTPDKFVPVFSTSSDYVNALLLNHSMTGVFANALALIQAQQIISANAV